MKQTHAEEQGFKGLEINRAGPSGPGSNCINGNCSNNDWGGLGAGKILKDKHTQLIIEKAVEVAQGGIRLERHIVEHSVFAYSRVCV